METSSSHNGLTVKAYKGDAMTLLAFDLDESKLKNFVGFSIKATPPEGNPFYLYNRITFKDEVYQKSGIDLQDSNIKPISTKYSPLQTFRWVHTPSVNHNTEDLVFGTYQYEVTPRYMIDNVLQYLDKELTVAIKIDVSPYQKDSLQIGFTRGFIESQGYVRKFGLNNKVRPNNNDLIFKIGQKSGPLEKDKNNNQELKDYSFEQQFNYLGWQARTRILEFLEETLHNQNLFLDVFAFDIDEPTICQILLELAKQSRLRIILDNSETHTRLTDYETKFEEEFNKLASDKSSLYRGKFKSLAHSKVFIQKDDSGKALKVLTGSTNFTTNGLYINANHVLIFNDSEVAELYKNAFDESFGDEKMSNFDNSDIATKDFTFSKPQLPHMVVRFSPHQKAVAEKFFQDISQRILHAETDVLFAIMRDNSKSSILDAVQTQVRSDKVYTYGVTDTIGDKTEMFLYKPNSKKGIRVAGKVGKYILPPPFEEEANIPGISIHHKFIVVDFKGIDPTLYCGSSNLAFTPEQKNGDNLIEIHDKDTVTVFAIEAIRLIDHFHFRCKQNQLNKDITEGQTEKKIYLNDSSFSEWIKPFYNSNDLKYLERNLLIK